MSKFVILERGTISFTEPQFCGWFMNCPTKIFEPPEGGEGEN